MNNGMATKEIRIMEPIVQKEEVGDNPQSKWSVKRELENKEEAIKSKVNNLIRTNKRRKWLK